MAETGQTRTIDSNGNTVVTSSEGLSYTIINNGTAPGVPQIPSQPSAVSTPSAPAPQKVPNFEVKQKLLRPALTSHFQCVFNPPDVPEIRQYYLEGGKGGTITLLCSDASLPGSSVLTNEINDDFTGVTERLGYRRQYDNTTDFTFYVDHGTRNGGYNVIRLFEAWIRYAMGETSEAPDSNYYYRVRYPDEPKIGYRTEMFIQKFERDFFGNYLEYVFVRAFPIAITSMPVSYNASELLKCTVSFTYNRYVLRSRANKLESEPAQPTATGIPPIFDPNNPPRFEENPTFTNPQFGINEIPLITSLGTNPGQINPGSGGLVS
jgi:hypothetical protein